MGVDGVGHQVVNVVSLTMQVPVDEIMLSRNGRGWQARKVAYVLMRDQGLSYPEIAKVFGRDHTTVMDGCKKAGEQERELAAAAAGWLRGDSYQLRVWTSPEGDVEVSVADPRAGRRTVLEAALAEELVRAVFRTETSVLGLR